jgi:hypothetical protein
VDLLVVDNVFVVEGDILRVQQIPDGFVERVWRLGRGSRHGENLYGVTNKEQIPRAGESN